MYRKEVNNMKKLIFLLIILSLVFIGCCPTCPEEELVPAEVEFALDCDGHYMVVYDDFQMGDWTNCDFFAPAGIYWENDTDGRIFFLAEIGDIEIEIDCCEDGIGYDIPDPIEMFGACPDAYEWELIVPEAE